MLYLGCDQHKSQITISLRDDAGQRLTRRQISTRPDKIQAFFETVQQQAGEEGFMASIEVCGFNDWFLGKLAEFGCREIVLIHPDKPGKKKTDRRDADKLSQLLWLNRERLKQGETPHGLRRVRIPSRPDTEDRQLTSHRRRIQQQRTRTVNAVQGILRKHNLTWEQPTKGIDTKTVRRWLLALTLPAIDRLEMNQHLERWTLWDQQLFELDEILAQRSVSNPSASLIKTIPGIADYAALGLACRIGDVRRFPRPRSLANYFGLTPSCRNSGEKTDRLGSITKEGSSFARFILGQAVLHVLKRDREMKNWYRGIKQRRGSKIARVAVMRRLCTILWHMLTYGEPYCVGGPPRLKHRRPLNAQAA